MTYVPPAMASLPDWQRLVSLAVNNMASSSGTGTVTSVGLSMPTGFTVTGSPVTTAGTLAVSTTLNGYIKGNGTGFTASSTVATTDLSGTLQAAQFPALTGDVTNTAGTVATTISAGAVTLAKMANLAANSILGNNTAVAATPLALTGAQVTAMLSAFSSTVQGVVPASGGGTTNFLRADGSWASPAGGGGSGASTGLVVALAARVFAN